MNGPVVFLALVNPKSGGNVGTQLLERFKEILDENKIYNLSEGGPRKALEDHGHKENLRLIACGGDGTVGWILSVMDSMSFPPGKSPAIGIIPLGTGNDLSRSLNWGGKYRDKPLRKVLLDMAKADVANMDRWTLKVDLDPSSTEEQEDISDTGKHGQDDLPINVLNNYFSVGIDAHIALNFHRARNNNPNHFTSRTRNLLYYGIEGGKDLFKHQWRNLMDVISIECDGEDYTQRLKAYGTHSVLFLNIKSFSGGTRPWNRKNGVQDMSDGLLEVVAIDNLDLAILQAGGSGASVCQCRRAVITTRKPVPMQVDGEPCLMKPCTVTVSMEEGQAKVAKMLARNKNATFAVKDDEIENWAAQKIQRSFKQYKHQKSNREKTLSPAPAVDPQPSSDS